MNAAPTIAVLAGMNGAGKSTLSRLVIEPLGLEYINPDLLALEAYPDDPISQAKAAASLAEARRTYLLSQGRSFAFETVLSDPVGAKVALLQQAQNEGYHVMVIFVGLSSPELSQLRIAQRVAAGGHAVPDEKVFARYPRILANLQRLLGIPDDLHIYDNSSSEQPYHLLAKLERGRLTHVSRTLPGWIAFLDLESRITGHTHFLP